MVSVPQAGVAANPQAQTLDQKNLTKVLHLFFAIA
jgi:hypothetical protein